MSGERESDEAMNFLVTWKYETRANKTAASKLRLLSAFSGTKWIEVFDNTFIVSVPSREEYTRFYKEFIAIVKEIESIKVILSPPIESGKYQGYIDGELWSKINEMTLAPSLSDD